MITVNLKPQLHRNQDCVLVEAPNTSVINNALKKIAGIKFSKTHRSWYLPLSQENCRAITHVLQPVAIINTAALKDYLQKRKLVQQINNAGKPYQVSPNPQRPSGNEIVQELPAAPRQHSYLKKAGTAAMQICPCNQPAVGQLIQHLQLKRYSESTIDTYTRELVQFLAAIKNTPATEFSPQRLKDYLQYCHTKLKLSEATMHSRINALKYFYEQVLNREKFFWEIPRPKKPIQLPKIFNQDEIAAIINNEQNKKHKVMLMLAYSAGLRVSEVVALKTYNIDSSRMTIFIKEAKGKKDRIASLSPVLLVMLREYAKEYNPDKKGYLFEGNTKGVAYATRSLQEVIQKAKSKAGVMKPGGIHCLRHSFATHLIDRGTDVTMIQKLLGHNDLKTTLRYLHTSNKDLLKIISPLDDLKLD